MYKFRVDGKKLAVVINSAFYKLCACDFFYTLHTLASGECRGYTACLPLEYVLRSLQMSDWCSVCVLQAGVSSAVAASVVVSLVSCHLCI